jgi:hypothetical protein
MRIRMIVLLGAIGGVMMRMMAVVGRVVREWVQKVFGNPPSRR